MLNKLKKFLFNPKIRFGYLSKLGLYNNMSDEKYIKKQFKLKKGYELDLENPKTFNEKLQWLKLNDRKPEYTNMVDKYMMREYVSDKIGEKYLTPLIGVWENSDDINFDELPNKFVLKCNHNSGTGMYICTDKKKLNIKKVKKELNKGLKENYYLTSREWPYKNVKRRIICEEYMIDNDRSDNSLTDYKFFCFNGIPKFMYISQELIDDSADYYDMNFKQIDLKLDKSIPKSGLKRSKLECFEKMKEVAKILSENTKFLRVDFYYIEGQIKVGELTFYHNAGYTPIEDYETDLKLGNLIDLNK